MGLQLEQLLPVLGSVFDDLVGHRQPIVTNVCPQLAEGVEKVT
jgi:hypothetical protein